MLVLLAKNLPFDVVNINLTNKPEWFLKETEGQLLKIKFGLCLQVVTLRGLAAITRSTHCGVSKKSPKYV